MIKATINKAREIKNAQISFVSLVDKAANQKQFLITKAEDGNADFQTYGRIIKTDSESHYVTGVVYEPMVEDAHGDFMTAEEITKAAYWFAKNGNSVDLQHSFQSFGGAKVVENWIAKADFELGGEAIKQGTWLMTVEVTDDSVWDSIQKGEITGFSMGGHGIYSDENVDLESLEKGAVKDTYNERTKGSLFWNALDALENHLKRWNFQDEKTEFETNEQTIRECLSEFSTIIIDILTSDSITKELASAAPAVIKSGKKMSGRNKQTLCGIYESLGAFLKEFDDPEKEDTDSNKNNEEESEVTKSEVEKIVSDSIAKALEGINPPEQSEAVEKAADNTAVTAEFIAETVQEAIKKALEPEQPKPETVTAEQVQKMIADAVAKAVEPIRKQTGLPTNLNDDKKVEKQAEQHYLHGIL